LDLDFSGPPIDNIDVFPATSYIFDSQSTRNEKGGEAMRNRLMKCGGRIVCGACFAALSLLVGCDSSEPPPAQTRTPVATPQPSPPQTAAPVPSPQPVQTSPPPQQASPAPSVAPPVVVPVPAPAVTQPAPTPPPAVSQGAVAQNFSQVQMGMTSQEVLQLLGSPTKSKQKHQETEWEYYTPQGKFEIEFQMDKVVKIEKH
jgi:hypothetical protein